MERRSWLHPQEPTGDDWLADVLADPRARRQSQRGLHGHDLRIRPAFYGRRDETHETILVACSKCDWKAAFEGVALISSHGAGFNLVELLRMLSAPLEGWATLGSFRRELRRAYR